MGAQNVNLPVGQALTVYASGQQAEVWLQSRPQKRAIAHPNQSVTVGPMRSDSVWVVSGASEIEIDKPFAQKNRASLHTLQTRIEEIERILGEGGVPLEAAPSAPAPDERLGQLVHQVEALSARVNAMSDAPAAPAAPATDNRVDGLVESIQARDAAASALGRQLVELDKVVAGLVDADLARQRAIARFEEQIGGLSQQIGELDCGQSRQASKAEHNQVATTEALSQLQAGFRSVGDHLEEIAQAMITNAAGEADRKRIVDKALAELGEALVGAFQLLSLQLIHGPTAHAALPEVCLTIEQRRNLRRLGLINTGEPDGGQKG